MSDLIAKGRQPASLYLKQEFGTDKGKRQLDTVLTNLLRRNRKFDEDVSNWCLSLMAGGQNPEEYLKYLGTYNSSPICGLVWNANFVAYRCRDCAISPCMSLCADCFQNGDHEGHDFNMFRSQAGGACDCGDESVMRSQGFCVEHNPNRTRTKKVVPDEHLLLARAIIPRLFLKLYHYYRDDRLHGERDSPTASNMDYFFSLLNKLSDIDCLRDIMVAVMLSKIAYAHLHAHFGSRHSGHLDLKPVCSPTTGRTMIPSISASSSARTVDFTSQADELAMDSDSDSGLFCDNSSGIHASQEEQRSFLDFLMSTLVHLEFPNSLATFLLRLLPDQTYKVMFTRTFCQYYHKIGEALRQSTAPDDLSNHVVHVSVQLFSSEQLALQMVKEEGLLESMCSVLVSMMQHCLEPCEYVNIGDDSASTVLVADCDSPILSKHCYWPIACDLINILSHKSVVEVFFTTDVIIRQWLHFTTLLTGMNINERRVTSHVEFESRTYYTAFSVEFESVAAVMWELHRGCAKLKESKYCTKMIRELLHALSAWHEMVPSMPSKSIMSFHLALHRYLALFLSQATGHFKLSAEDVLPSKKFVAGLLEYPLRALVAFNEIKSGYWFYNGHEMRSQAQSYVQSHFCNSMVDLDLFIVQIAASVLDPDYFLKTIVDRFGLESWFQFGKPDEKLPPRANSVKEHSMVEGLLNFILTVLSQRVYSGYLEITQLRKDIATQLCIADRPHSKLSDLIPGRPGDSHVCMKDFESTLAEIADYKSPSFESGGMQQGSYIPKDFVWENEFDYNHIQLRCYARSDHQAALERYMSYFQAKGLAATSHCWPYPRKLDPILPGYKGLLNLLHCKTLHQIIFFVLQKAVDDPNTISENILISAINLLYLCVDTEKPEKVQDFSPVIEEKHPGLLVATKCLDYLDKYGSNERGLYTLEELDCSNLSTDLSMAMIKDKTFTLKPNAYSCKEISKTLFAVVFSYCFNTLFGRMMEYINNILGEILSPNSVLTNIHINMHHLHDILSLLSKSSYTFLGRLLKHWKRSSRIDGIPVKDFPFPVRSEERIAFSILVNFLTRNLDWLFQVVIPKEGYPLHAFSIEYPSNSIIDNSVVYLGRKDGLTSQRSQDDPSDRSNTRSPEKVPEHLVTELMTVIQCTEERAIQLLEKYDNNMEFAICMVMDEVEPLDVEVTEKEESDGNARIESMEDEGIDENEEPETECIISLLVKLRKSLLYASTNRKKLPVRAESRSHDSVVGDGAFYIKKLLYKFCSLSSECSSLVDKLATHMDFQMFDPDNRRNLEPDVAAKLNRKEKAAERQKKLLLEFARRQERFFKTLTDGQDQAMDVDQEDNKGQPVTEEYDCVICAQATPSTEDRPVGLVVLMQPSTNLGHRQTASDNVSVENPASWSNVSGRCMGVVGKRKDALLKSFEKVAAVRLLEVGLDCGLHIQTCGHYLHVHCQQSYYKALKEEQERDVLQLQPLIFNAERGYFTCPLCRQPSNGFLPILPDSLKPRSKEADGREDTEICECISRMLGRYAKKGRMTMLTAKSLALSVLSASFSTLADSMATLLKDGGSMVTSAYSDRTSKEKFSILVAAARANLELEYLERSSGAAIHASRNTFMEALIEGLHFYALSIDNPMIDVWEQLKNPVAFETQCSYPISRSRPPILLYDVTSLLLQFSLTWPNRMSVGEYYCLVQHLFNLRYVQAVVNICFELQGDEKKRWEETGFKTKEVDGNPDINIILSMVASTIADINFDDPEVTGISQSVLSPRTIECRIQKFCLPFLRIAALIGDAVFGKTLPCGTNDVQSEFYSLASVTTLFKEDRVSKGEMVATTECLIRYPTCSWPEAIKCWCRQLSAFRPQRGACYKDMLPPSHIWERPRLLSLPQSYDKLFDRYRKQQCSKCGKVPTDPTLCLVCGAFLCYHAGCCVNEQGVYECVQHSVDCGCGTGVFLIISSSVVFIIRFDRGCIWGSVYLDSFGEEDRNLRRGKPLFLSQQRFDLLEQQWSRHNFDRTCKKWGFHMNSV